MTEEQMIDTAAEKILLRMAENSNDALIEAKQELKICNHAYRLLQQRFELSENERVRVVMDCKAVQPIIDAVKEVIDTKQNSPHGLAFPGALDKLEEEYTKWQEWKKEAKK